jgi:hypothetical protein
VALFNFFSWCLLFVAAATLLWPLNVPLLAAAFKIRQGQNPLGMPGREFWMRSIGAGLGLAALSLVLVGLTFLLVYGAEFPSRIIHLVLFVLYGLAAVCFLFWVYALEDLLQALSVFLIFVLLAALPLFLVGRLLGARAWLESMAPWILPGT